MPTYTFRCACGNEFDTVASMGTEIVPCDQCHSGAKRQFSVAQPFQLRHWPDRFAVTRSQVGERYVRSKWRGGRFR